MVICFEVNLMYVYNIFFFQIVVDFFVEYEVKVKLELWDVYCGFVYDVVWVMVLVLNKIIFFLDFVIVIDQILYGDKMIIDVFIKVLKEINFLGVIVSFWCKLVVQVVRSQLCVLVI